MWILPTRSRPANMARFIKAWHDTEASTELKLLLDADDPYLADYLKLEFPSSWEVTVTPERRTLIQLNNDVFYKHPNEKWYGGMSDDMMPYTKHWDRELILSAESDKITWPDDFIQGPNLATSPVIGGDLVREMGWFLYPELIRLYGDTVWTAIGKKRNLLRYRGDVKIEHLHFSTGKGAYDETAKKPDALKDRATFDKWLWSFNPSVTFAVVKWGTKYSADYVNILFDMIERNLPSDFGKKFVCFTEDPTGLDESIEVRPLPGDLVGWWNKLYLFKLNVFDEGERVCFLDLDTAILGDISQIASYKGEFAILRDFYRPQGFNSGLMLWRGGFGTNIWDSFLKAGKPDIEGGDQVWIEKRQRGADILQDKFLGCFASYKEKGKIAPPRGTKIVCFHGDPKPHQIKDGWVPKVWKKGGEIRSELENQSETNPIENVRSALTLPFPNLRATNQANTACPVNIVGDGASSQGFIEELKLRQKEGQEIWALDDNYLRLREAGLEPDAHIISSPEKENAYFVPEKSDATLFYASQCHPDVFAKAQKNGKQIIIWHPLIDGIRNAMGKNAALLLGGGTTTPMYAISLAYTLGVRDLHLFGYDSSFSGEPKASDDERISINVGSRQFNTTLLLAQQINEFRMLLQSLTPQGMSIKLYGDGLLPSAMEAMHSKKAGL